MLVDETESFVPFQEVFRPLAAQVWARHVGAASLHPHTPLCSKDGGVKEPQGRWGLELFLDRHPIP